MRNPGQLWARLGVFVVGLALGGCLAVEQPYEPSVEAAAAAEDATSRISETLDQPGLRSVRVRVQTRHYGAPNVMASLSTNAGIVPAQCSGLQISSNLVLTAAHCVAADAFQGDQTRDPWNLTHSLVTGKWINLPNFVDSSGVALPVAYAAMTIECPGFRETGNVAQTGTSVDAGMTTSKLVRVSKVYVTTGDIAVLYVPNPPSGCRDVNTATFESITSTDQTTQNLLHRVFGSGSYGVFFYGFGSATWANSPYVFSDGTTLRGRSITFGSDVFDSAFGHVGSSGGSMKALLTAAFAMGTPGDSGGPAFYASAYGYGASTSQAVVNVQVTCSADMPRMACERTPTCAWKEVTSSNAVAHCGLADLDAQLCDYATAAECAEDEYCYHTGTACRSRIAAGSLTGVTALLPYRTQILAAHNTRTATSNPGPILKTASVVKPIVDVFFAAAKPLTQLPDTGTSMTPVAVNNSSGEALNAVESRNWDLPAPLSTLRTDTACLAQIASLAYSSPLPGRSVRLDHEIKLEFGTSDSPDVPRLIAVSLTAPSGAENAVRGDYNSAVTNDCRYNVKYFNGSTYVIQSLPWFIDNAMQQGVPVLLPSGTKARVPSRLVFTKAGVLGKQCHIEACSASCTAGCVLEVPYERQKDKRQYVDFQQCTVPTDSYLPSSSMSASTAFFYDTSGTTPNVCKETKKIVLPAHVAMIINLGTAALINHFDSSSGLAAIDNTAAGFTSDLPADLLAQRNQAFADSAWLRAQLQNTLRNGTDPNDVGAAVVSNFEFLLSRVNNGLQLSDLRTYLDDSTATDQQARDRVRHIFMTGFLADYVLNKADVWDWFYRAALAVTTLQDLTEIDIAYLANRMLWETHGTELTTIRSNLDSSGTYPYVPMVAATERIVFHPTGGLSSSNAWGRISSATFGRRISASSWGRISDATWRRVTSGTWFRISDFGAEAANRAVNGGTGTEFAVGSATWSRISSSTWGSRIGSATWTRISDASWSRISDRSWGRISSKTWGRIGSASWGRISASTWGRIGSASWGRISAGSWGRIGDTTPTR